MAFFTPRSLRRGFGSSFILSLFSKGSGYARQLLIAYFFGITRGLDIYFMAYSLATVSVFSLQSLFDQVATPHLVRQMESESKTAFHELAASLFKLSWLMGLALCLLFILFLPLLIWMLAHGFSAPDRIAVRYMAWNFIPWILLSLPLAAMGSILKSRRYYDVVLFGDFLVSIVATGLFVFWHTGPQVLPLILGVGCGCSVLWSFFFFRQMVPLEGKLWTPLLKPLGRNFVELFSVNQLGSLGTVVDRFFQSYLRPGSIAIFSYASSTLAPVSDFVLFKELYIVPLSAAEGRKERLERLMTGLILTNVPLALFLATNASGIVQTLYQHGRFDAAAHDMTAKVFSLWALTLITTGIANPAFRMFQILDRIRYTGIVYLISSAVLALLSYLFIFHYQLDVLGFTLALVLSSALILIPIYLLLARSHLKIRVAHLAQYGAFSTVASLLAAWVVRSLPIVAPVWLNLGVRTSVFFAVIGLTYLPLRRHIVRVLYGNT